MNNNERVRDLEEYCSSSRTALNDNSAPSSLSPDILREKLSHISALQTSSSHFFHELCLNRHVTLEIVALVLNFNPYAAHLCSTRYHGISYNEEDIIESSPSEFDSENNNNEAWTTTINSTATTLDSGKFCSDRAYPIHLACANEHCPNSIIELLARSNPSALGHGCILENYGICIYCDYGICTDCADEDHVEGVPLHYYFSRPSNMELDTVKILIEAHPDSLIDGRECYPSHVLVANGSVGTKRCDIIEYLARFHPSCLQCTDFYDQIPLHVACYQSHMTAHVIRLLVEGWPDSTRQFDCYEKLPIHHLCERQGLDDVEVRLNILKILVDADPGILGEWNGGHSRLPIHIASKYQCPAFNKILVDEYPSSLRVGERQHGNLPLHLACEYGSLDTVKYLHEADPQSIFAMNNCGLYPLHMAMSTRGGYQAEVTRFILSIDPDSASRTIPKNASGPYAGYEYMPLHLACTRMAGIDAVKLLFDANPHAIHCRVKGKEPLEIARAALHSEAVIFLEQQNNDISAFSYSVGTPIHDALRNNVTLGAIKLILDGFPNSIFANDTNQDSALHFACRAGRYEVVNYFLETKIGLGVVSEPNGEKKLPIELLLEASCDRDDVGFTESIWSLLVAHPEAVLAIQSGPDTILEDL